MKKFSIVSPLNGTGYGIASIGYLNQLCEHNPEISVIPIGNISNQAEISPKVLDCMKAKPDFSLPVFCFWHLFDIPKQIAQFTGRKVGFTTFELNTLNDKEQEALKGLDAIGTASAWGARILGNYFDKKIFVASHALRAIPSQKLPVIYESDHISIWNKILAPSKIPSNSFLLSTAGKWESRKGHPELIDAGVDLKLDRPIVLIAFFNNPFIQDNFPYGFINSKGFYPMYTDSGIKLYKKDNFYLIMMPPTNTRSELHSALSKADFFISPSKGEGWNLPLFEMMSLGMKCITTLYSAHTEYCSEANVVPVYPDKNAKLVSAMDGHFFDGSSQWLNVTKQGIASAIKEAYILPEVTRKNLSKEAIYSTSSFSWEESAKIIQNLMNQF